MIELTLTKSALLSSLMAISGAVDKKQSLMILSNILMTIGQDHLLFTATDLEIEITASLDYFSSTPLSGKITIPAKKLLDIVRFLDEDELKMSIDEGVVIIKSGRSQFKLSTLPADQYPESDNQLPDIEFSIARDVFLNLIQSTHFAMAQQDVRIFLNSLLIEMDGQFITTVAMDGHRMAVSRFLGDYHFSKQQFLLPRRSVSEMLRLLNVIQDEQLAIKAGKGFFSVCTRQFSFITKLTEARFPNYHKILPRQHDKFVLIERDYLKRALSRISILANEKTHGILLNIQPGSLILIAKNQEQEEANEQLEATVDGEALKVGMNAVYLLDVLNYVPEGLVRLSMSTMEQSILIESLANESHQYIIMPMKL